MNISQTLLEQGLAASLQTRISHYESTLKTIIEINQAVEQNRDTERLFEDLSRYTSLAAAEENRAREMSTEFMQRKEKASPELQGLIDRAEQVLKDVVAKIDEVVTFAQTHRDALEPQIKTQAQGAKMRSAYKSATKYGT